MIRRTIARPVIATAMLLACSAVDHGTEPGQRVTIWPGYSFEFPADHCADKVSPVEDFDVYFLRSTRRADAPLLLGIYAGYAPDFPEDPTVRVSSAHGLEVRFRLNAEGRSEFLILDPLPASERGVLHIWFGPAADDDARLAERIVQSVQPAAIPPADAPGLPACD